jgi:hypothetical protein
VSDRIPFSFSEVNHDIHPVLDVQAAAAWVFDKEVFCEGHKEMIIEIFGVDHFPILRLTNDDEAFVVCGRFPKSNPTRKLATTTPRGEPDGKSLRN